TYFFYVKARNEAGLWSAVGASDGIRIAAIIRVKRDSGVNGPGTDWNSAYHTVAAAIAASVLGGEIWVAGDSAHPFSERITLKLGVGHYGGFAGTETTRAERNWKTNVTILDGSAATVVTAPTGATATTALDGFTVRNGSSGIYCTSSPSITNNTFMGNSTGIFCIGSSPSITNNIVSVNGEGIICYPSSYPTITNNTISGNSKNGVWCASSPLIANNIVAFNTTGIYKSSGTPELVNNCVYNPTGTNYSGLLAGIGDISIDPLFADRAAGNLRILLTSPCVDAGSDAKVPAWLLRDMDGNPRISGLRVDLGAYEFQVVAPLTATIAEARGSKDGVQVSLAGAIVTASWQDVLYIEQSGRACGMRISKAGHGLQVGQTATVSGTMATTQDGERMLEASTLSGSTGQPLGALGMSASTVGGAATPDYSAANGTGQQGVTGGVGVNNIGLLLRVAGRVTFLDPGGAFLTISDGSGVVDPDGHIGIRISAQGIIPTGLAVGDFVTVTGISSCSKSGSDLLPKVLARSAGEIIKQAP
ncbi:MAG: right-handed parallel beta-helix repeat-containing protein, partial [Armatimonadota bacterium]